ncbi:MAG: hypothetical protein ACI9EH_000616, partial [Planktomarina sp.]
MSAATMNNAPQPEVTAYFDAPTNTI